MLRTILHPADVLAILAGLLAGVALVGILFLVWRGADNVDERAVLVAVVVLTTLFQTWWVLVQKTSTSSFPDSQEICAYAVGPADGDWSEFSAATLAGSLSAASEYFSLYPFQSGFYLYVILVYRMFGAGNVVALQVVNIVANEVSLLALWAIGRLLLDDVRERVVMLVLLVTCLPLWLLVSFPYGNCIGLPFALLFLLLQAGAMESEDRRVSVVRVLVSLVPLSIALVLKGTYVLFGIAAVLSWVLCAAMRRDALPALLALAVVFVALRLALLPVGVLEGLADEKFGSGLPTQSWIAIGLSDQNPCEMPGWWSPTAIEAFDQTGGDHAAQVEIADARLAEEARDLLGDPARAVSFFGAKLTSEWAEPTYQSVFYASSNVDAEGNAFDPFAPGLLPNWARAPLRWFFDGWQAAVYLGALACLAISLKTRGRDGTILLLGAVVFVGFGCYLLWEAKSVYAFPFLTAMLPLAAAGMGKVFGCVISLWHAGSSVCSAGE